MPTGFYLSETDLDVLRDVVKDFRERSRNETERRYRPESPTAPECFLARVGEDGLAAVGEGMAPGSSFDPGTFGVDGLQFGGDGGFTVDDFWFPLGSESGDVVSGDTDDVIAGGECQIYRLLGEPPDEYLEEQDFTRYVHNLSGSAVEAGTLVLVHKDKFGKWFIGGGGGGGAAGYLVLTPSGGIPALNPGADTGTGTAAGGGVNDDAPGRAYCAVYKELDLGAVSEFVHQGFSVRVLNTLDLDIPAGRWVTAVRDAYGGYYVPNSGLLYGFCE